MGRSSTIFYGVILTALSLGIQGSATHGAYGLSQATAIEWSSSASADPRVKWLQEHVVPIGEIDSTQIADDDFADLLPLMDLIGEARIVTLGEQSHGDGATFMAKVRLVQFLHEKMGFDLFVWESGMYDCTLVDAAFKAGASGDDAAAKGIFPIWGWSDQVKPVLEYVAETQGTDSPIEIAGFDCQVTGGTTLETLMPFLAEALAQVPVDSVTVEVRADFDELLETLKSLGKAPYTPDDATHARLMAAAEAVATVLAAQGQVQNVAAGDFDAQLASRALRNLATLAAMFPHIMKMQSGADDGVNHQLEMALLREKGMADTMIWLARERYPERKMVVWGASSHLSFNSRGVEMRSAEDPSGWAFDDAPWEPMGNAMRVALGDEMYGIMFLAYGGTAGSVMRPNTWEIPTAPAGSFGALCHETGVPNLFLDLRILSTLEGGEWLLDRLVARPRGYGEMRASWPTACDAFVFTDVMTPSTRTVAETTGGEPGK